MILNFLRGRKVEDKEVFIRLRQLLRKLNISMEEFFDFDSSLIFDDINQKIKGRLHNKIMKKICEETKLIKRPYFLLKRTLVKYFCQAFSCREVKNLERIVMNLKRGYIINESTLLNSFPGKTLKTLFDAIQNVLQGKFIEDFMKD